MIDICKPGLKLDSRRVEHWSPFQNLASVLNTAKKIVPNFHIHTSVSHLYIPQDRSSYFAAAK